MSLFRRLRFLFAAIIVLAAMAPAARAESADPFCADAGCVQTRALLRNLCDYVVKEKAQFSTIYIGGYYMRTLVAGYEIFGDRRYLDTAIAYGDTLLARQMPNGFWSTGYGPVYMADTGSALGLLVVLYKHVDHDRQQKYLAAVQHYVDSIEADNMIHPNGAFGTGWRGVKDGNLQTPIYDQYTLSSALTGGDIFTWMYHVTGKNKYREIAYNAFRWILSTMDAQGNIPHILAMEGLDWDKRSDPKIHDALYNRQAFGTSAYVGEGILSFALHCDNAKWTKWIESAVRPNIEFLLRTQLPDGTWSTSGAKSWDRTRSPGIVDYLIWYYTHVQRDPRIVAAVRRFDAHIITPEGGKSFGLLNDGAETGPKDANNAWNTATSLTGRTLADIIRPGVDSEW
jgi:hypothetical protein